MNGTAKAHALGISMKNKQTSKKPLWQKGGQTLACTAQRICGVVRCGDIQSPGFRVASPSWSCLDKMNSRGPFQSQLVFDLLSFLTAVFTRYSNLKKKGAVIVPCHVTWFQWWVPIDLWSTADVLPVSSGTTLPNSISDGQGQNKSQTYF